MDVAIFSFQHENSDAASIFVRAFLLQTSRAPMRVIAKNNEGQQQQLLYYYNFRLSGLLLQVSPGPPHKKLWRYSVVKVVL